MQSVKRLSPEAHKALERASDLKRDGSQAKAAARLGVSAAVVNQLLKHKYAGDVPRMETRIRGELMNETVQCPVLGELSKRDCLDNQGRPFAATNPQRVRLFHACKECPNRERKENL